MKLSDKIIENRLDMLYDILCDYKDKYDKFTGYVYMLINKKNDKKYIGGSKEKLTKVKFVKHTIKKKKIDNLLLKDLREYKLRDYDYVLLDERKYYGDLEFGIILDSFKYKYGTIDNGYNRYSYRDSDKLFSTTLQTITKEQIKRNIYVEIQKELFKNSFTDSNKYTGKGYIYIIRNKHNKKTFFNYVDNKRTLKEEIMELYDVILSGNVKQNKMLKALQNEPYDNFKYKVIKHKKDEQLNLQRVTNDLIDKYQTIRYGYNNKRKMKR